MNNTQFVGIVGYAYSSKYSKSLRIKQESKQAPSEEQFIVLSNFIANMILASQRKTNTNNVQYYLDYIRSIEHLTLGEMLMATQILEKLIRQCNEKNDKVVTTGNLRISIVCVFLICLKFLRDEPRRNSWWAQKLEIELESINEFEIIILNLLDWQLWMSDANYTQIYSRIF
ncbi:MAG: hypothetical protein EZS28_042707 [Streblomastix strix]|uniref:Cyclin N-terminal domain-containing protein n=1 Tax=Streblomastix strix TaxID=222440 RepID=A0A5J4TTA3_9EUKA|nr:MAG: hypothetical protein EZS28_042707 [Streblomastix strix]